MTQHGLWLSYSGTADIALAVVLAGAAAWVAYAGLRLPLPAQLPQPGRKARAFLLVIWLTAIAAFLGCDSLLALRAQHAHLSQNYAADPITPVTVIAFGIIWFAIALLHSSRGWRVALGSAAIGALAAPWIFELPFDLIIMTRTAPLPSDPAGSRILFFAPLLAVAVTTLARLTASPVVRLSRATLCCLAGMLAVFAAWGLIGFAYPSAPAPFALNVMAKILAFLTAFSMFMPDRTQPSTAEVEPSATPAWTGVM